MITYIYLNSDFLVPFVLDIQKMYLLFEFDAFDNPYINFFHVIDTAGVVSFQRFTIQ